MSNPILLVVDGRGGGIGKTIIEKLNTTLTDINLIAIGTNPFATEAMRKSGAHSAYSGEDELISYAKKADIIVGVMGILIPDSMSGELTENMANAISKSDAIKVLIPMNKCGIRVAVPDIPLSLHIDAAIEIIKKELS